MHNTFNCKIIILFITISFKLLSQDISNSTIIATNSNTPRSLANRTADTINVKDYGAIGTDVPGQDDYPAISNAIAAAVATGKELVFPSGIYRHSQTLQLGFAHLRVRGEGHVVLKHTGNGGYCVSIDAGINTILYDHMFDNFTIEGNPTSSSSGLFIRNFCHRITRNIRIRNVSLYAFLIDGDVLSHYENCIVTPAGNPFQITPTHGFVLSSTTNIPTTTACTFNNCFVEIAANYGFYLDAADSNVFIGGSSEGLAGTGLYISSLSSKNTFINTFFEKNANGDLLCYGNSNEFRNCTMSSRASQAPYESVKSIILKMGCERNRIIGGTFYAASIESNATANSFEFCDSKFKIFDNGVMTHILNTRQLYNSSTILLGQ